MRPEIWLPALALLTLGGCATTSEQEPTNQPQASPASSPDDKPLETSTKATLQPPEPADDLWERIRRGFALTPNRDRPAVRQWVQFYASHKKHLGSAAERARPFLWHIVESVEAHDMPLEIALLPIVESGFDPSADSYASAAGLWQFTPVTARRFGLERNWWYDERRDVLASTRAALDYLVWLHDRFDSWLLALAAYNTGEGRVDRAIAEADSADRPTDYWHLDLPAETENYVPKLLALRRLLQSPQRYALDWPSLPNKQLTRTVELPGQVELAQVAGMLEIKTPALRGLNPAYRRWATDPDAPHALLVPANEAQALGQALAAADPDSLMTRRRHRVSRGESLGTIAQRFDTSVAQLRRINDLESSVIHPGDRLLLPVGDRPPARPADQPVRRNHKVRSGESLWTIARSYETSVDQLRQWNDLDTEAVLQPGQTLRVPDTGAAREVTYEIKAGDSLWSVAQHFDVSMADLRRWNNLSAGSVLHPGQTLTLRPDGARRLVTYQVAHGDSLWSIASRFSVDVAELRDWNGLPGNGTTLQPGQELRILVDATS